MLTTIVVANATPGELIGIFRSWGIAGATLWKGYGYGTEWPTESVTMIRLSVLDLDEVLLLGRKLARHFGEEAVYVESVDAGWLAYADQPHEKLEPEEILYHE